MASSQNPRYDDYPLSIDYNSTFENQLTDARDASENPTPKTITDNSGAKEKKPSVKREKGKGKSSREDCVMYMYLYMLALIKGRDLSTSIDGWPPHQHWRTYIAGQILVEGSEVDPSPNNDSQYNDSQLICLSATGSFECVLLPSQ